MEKLYAITVDYWQVGWDSATVFVDTNFESCERWLEVNGYVGSEFPNFPNQNRWTNSDAQAYATVTVLDKTENGWGGPMLSGRRDDWHNKQMISSARK